MGDHQHTVAVFIAQSDVRPIVDFHAQVRAREPLDPPHETSLVTPLVHGYNAYTSFAIMPHGASVGRPRSDEVGAFMLWARQLAAAMRIESVVLSFGDHGTGFDVADEDAIIDAEASEALLRLPRAP